MAILRDMTQAEVSRLIELTTMEENGHQLSSMEYAELQHLLEVEDAAHTHTLLEY